MCQVLLLTKCIQREEKIENDIKMLGHEVLCTSRYSQLISDDSVSGGALSIFQIVILSETIPEYEIKKLLPLLEGNFIRVIHRTNAKKNFYDEGATKKEQGRYFLTIDASIEELRDALTFDEDSTLTVTWHFDKKKLIKQISKIPYSTAERLIVGTLLEADGEVVSRESLCYKVWNREASNSNMSQLSNLTKRIRYKMIEYGIDGECLKTVWGRGYQLVLE